MNNALITFGAVTAVTLMVWGMVGRPDVQLIPLLRTIGALTALVIVADRAPQAAVALIKAWLNGSPGG